VKPSHLLEIDRLRLETMPKRGEPRVLVSDLSLCVDAGKCLAIVGESGSGKTLAARAILNLLPPGVRRVGGSIRLEARELTGLTPAQIRTVRGSDVGMVFQEPMSSLNPALKIGRQLFEGLKLHRGFSDDACREQAIAMLQRVRIANPEQCLRAYPHQFSGGMRQRIMLASVLLLHPKLLIADEPTTALDTLSQRDVLELMAELARDFNIATLLITHDLGLVSRYAERVVVLEKGVLRETGETKRVLTRPSHPYTRQLVRSRPERPPEVATGPESGPLVLEVDHACISYAGERGFFRAGAPKQIVHDVSFAMREGEILALVGTSGSGKTTLGRAVVGLKPLTSGTIRVVGKDIAALTPENSRQFRRQVQLVFQDPVSSLDPRMRVVDSVAAPLRPQRLGSAERIRRAEEALHQVGLEDFRYRLPHEMSGGQRQRVAIARAIVSRPKLVVADEPVSALDMTIQAQVLALLQRLQREYGFACLFITHDLAIVQQIADRVIVMSAGRIVEQGSASQVLSSPSHPYTRELIAATPHLPGELSQIEPGT
jgi:peptide/nickel transport system ATP-binding protein